MDFGAILAKIISGLTDYVLVPGIISLIGVIIVWLRKEIQSLLTSIKTKNNNATLESLTNIVSEALNQIQVVVTAAVSSNMAFAQKLKDDSADGALTDDEAVELQNMAKDIVNATLPSTLKEASMVSLLGGQDAIDKYISGMIETSLIDIKAKVAAATDNSSDNTTDTSK